MLRPWSYQLDIARRCSDEQETGDIPLRQLIKLFIVPTAHGAEILLTVRAQDLIVTCQLNEPALPTPSQLNPVHDPSHRQDLPALRLVAPPILLKHNLKAQAPLTLLPQQRIPRGRVRCTQTHRVPDLKTSHNHLSTRHQEVLHPVQWNDLHQDCQDTYHWA